MLNIVLCIAFIFIYKYIYVDCARQRETERDIKDLAHKVAEAWQIWNLIGYSSSLEIEGRVQFGTKEERAGRIPSCLRDIQTLFFF